jgi:hypothetical protein
MGQKEYERVKELTDGKTSMSFTYAELMAIFVLAGTRALDLKNVSPKELGKNPQLTKERNELLPVYQSIARKIGERIH